MTSGNPSIVRSVVGFLLILAGLVLFGVLAPIVAKQGFFVGLASLFLIVSCVGLGSFLFLRVRFRSAVKSLLIILGLSVPWFAIFFIPLPGEAQLVVAMLVALSAVLLYRHHVKRNAPLKPSEGR